MIVAICTGALSRRRKKTLIFPYLGLHICDLFTQAIQHLQIELSIYCFTRRNKLLMHNTLTVEKKKKWWALSWFSTFGNKVIPLSQKFSLVSRLCIKHQLSSSTIIESKNFGSFLTVSSTLHMCATLLALFGHVSAWDTNLTQIFHFFKSSCKINCTMVLDILVFSSIIRRPSWQSTYTTAATRATFASVFVDTGPPLCLLSLNNSLPSLNQRCQHLTVAFNIGDSP